MLALALLAAACSSGGAPKPGTVTRLDDPEGSAASFSFAYYTEIVAAGDRVAAAYMTLNGPQDRNVVVRVSEDGGASWSPQFVLNGPEYGDTISVAPKLALEPGGSLLAVWQSRRNRAGQKFILARRSTDFGKTWGPIQMLNTDRQSFPPNIATRPDGSVLVAFSDERNVERDVFVNRSSDGGSTWLPKDVPVNASAKTESIGPVPVLAAGGNDAWVIWEEKLRGNPQIQIARSKDGGLTWGATRRVDPEKQPASPIWPSMVEANGRLVAVWTAGVVGETTRSWLWVATSADGGETWSAPTQLYEGPVQSLFHLVARGPRVYLVWSGGGSEGPSGIYLNVSDDGGATWRQPIDAPLRLDDPAGKLAAGRPRLALAGDATVVAVWQAEERAILLRASKDDARTWSPAVDVATSTKNRLRFPLLATSEKSAWVLWEDWTDMKGVRKTLVDTEKLTPLGIFVRPVALP